MSDHEHAVQTTGELFEWCGCGAHRLNASWGGDPSKRDWVGGSTQVRLEPSLEDVMAKLEAMETRILDLLGLVESQQSGCAYGDRY